LKIPIIHSGTLIGSQSNTKTTEMNREQIDKLAELYSRDTTYAYIVATICDEVIDKSGALLGRVRVVARKMITDRLNPLKK